MDTEAQPLPPPEGKVNVTCPGCGQIQSITPLGYSGDDFCTRCDYPLFWAPYERPTDGRDPARPVVSVLPGVEGETMERYVMCSVPTCREPNVVSRRTCIRCGAPLSSTSSAVAPPGQGA